MSGVAPISAVGRASRGQRSSLAGRGGVSVSSGLTDPVSRAPSPSVAIGGGLRGGGFEAGRGMSAGRNVWEDRNAFGKFHQIHLVRLHGSLCLGVIGTDEFRVCRNLAVSCKIRGHKKNKFVLGCAVAYCIPAKRQRSTGHPAAFKFPLLDESKMTPEVRSFVEKHESDTSLTTRDWEAYMPQALRDFDLQERGVGGGIPEEKSNDSEEIESEDDLSLGHIPSLMPWDDPYEAPAPGLDFKMDDGETIGRHEMMDELKRLSDGLQKLGDQARKDSKDAVDYLWLSVHEVAAEVGQVNSQLIVLKDDVGDVAPLSELHNMNDLAEGVVEALVRVGAGELEEMETAITKCDTKVGYLTDLMGEIDEDHRGAATYALTKANEMSRRIGLLEVSSEGAPTHLSNMQSRSLAHDTVILDSCGDPVASMAELWRVVTELKASNMALTTRVSALTAEVSSQGGVVLGNMTFTSEAQIMQLVMMECPSGDAFEIFTDVMSLPCFDSSYEPAAGWEKTTKFMKRGGLKREYNTMGWSQEGIDFYNKVQEEWKKLSRENRLQLWEKLESEWFEYVDETGCSQGRRKKHKTNLEEEDVGTVPNLPRLPTEMVFFGDDDYQPDCPWKNSVDERGDDDTNEWDETNSHGESLRVNRVSLGV